MKSMHLWFAAAALFGLALSAGAEDGLEQKFSERLKSVLPDAKVTAVRPAPIAGLYEVEIGPTLLYMSGDGRYVIRGDVFDLQTHDNLTDARRAKARLAAFDRVGADSMIEFAPANGKPVRTLYVFTDVDCGYCRKMHQEVKRLTDAGIAVRYLAFPRSGLDSESYDKAVGVWCSPNRQQALTDAKLGKKLEAGKCDNPVAAHYHLGEMMGVRGTPAVYLDDGAEIGGYIPAGELIHMLLESNPQASAAQ